jgi:simple sugar transport system permease protein
MAQLELQRGTLTRQTLPLTYWLKRFRWVLLAFGVLVAIFIWRSITGTQPLADLMSVIVISLTFATPVTLGALGGTFSERSGVVNIGIEGMMLSGAFFGALVGLTTHQLWLAVIIGPLSAMVLALLHAVLSIYFRVDQIISGTVINIFAFGLSAYLNALVLRGNKDPNKLPNFNFKIGTSPYSIGIVTIVALLAVFIAHYVLFYTTWGLRTRAVGENPKAADTAGVNVFQVRYINVLISGLLAGLGGIYFSLQELGYFTEGMTVGTGFIALAAMIFGKWTPLGAWGAALLFGFSQAMDTVLQSWYGQVSWLHTITQALPYLVTIVVLTGLVGRSRPPAAVGTPYVKQ